MPLKDFNAYNFRCLKRIALEADPNYNLIYGANASGKTSILEAIAYLGRGKSFRGAAPRQLYRHGSTEFRLRGTVQTETRPVAVSVRNGKQGLEVKIDGDVETSAAALAEVLPLQVLDPEVHNLVAGSPEHRRRYLDWLAFHVEQGYAARWRRFRRALKQRNAALRVAGDSASLTAWDRELDQTRQRTLDKAQAALQETAGTLLDCVVRFEYRSGWAPGRSLEDTLAENREKDRLSGTTLAGPQRAELALMFDQRQAKRLVSRGQQKLLACAMILAATEVVQTSLGRALTLLLDDPAAELDRSAIDRLLGRVFGLGCQIIATALEAGTLRFPQPPAMFHVEQGELRTGAVL
ncbi:MAG: DNA replication/repair protein RecF [Woeseiaceae bacterium]